MRVSWWPRRLIPTLKLGPGAEGVETMDTVVMDRRKWVSATKQRPENDDYFDEDLADRGAVAGRGN